MPRELFALFGLAIERRRKWSLVRPAVEDFLQIGSRSIVEGHPCVGGRLDKRPHDRDQIAFQRRLIAADAPRLMISQETADIASEIEQSLFEGGRWLLRHSLHGCYLQHFEL